MSDSNNNPSAPPPPPDDFAKTTPNIKLPDNDTGSGDWGGRDSQYSNQPASDDWGNTVANIKPIDISAFDTGTPSPKVPDWGETRANINMDDFGSGSSGSADAGDFGKTTPYFKLPEAERAKYQNLPPTPTQQAEQEKAEAAAKGGIPGWVWAAGGISMLMIFLLLVLGVVAWIVLRSDSFELAVTNAPPGSDIYIDDVLWGTTHSDGSQVFNNVANGERKVDIKLQGFECESQKVKGNGDRVAIPALCREVEVKKGEDCTVIKMGEEDKAERCYYLALGALPDPFTVEELLKALNILVINFDSNKYDVPPKRMAAIKKGSEYIKRLNQLSPAIVIEIGGHTDSDGQDANNQTLSDNRAASVKNLLVEYGVPPQMLQTRGYGESQPIDTNDTPDGKFHNRRIQYSLVKK